MHSALAGLQQEDWKLLLRNDVLRKANRGRYAATGSRLNPQRRLLSDSLQHRPLFCNTTHALTQPVEARGSGLPLPEQSAPPPLRKRRPRRAVLRDHNSQSAPRPRRRRATKMAESEFGSCRRVKLVLGTPGGAGVRATRSPCGASGVRAGGGCGGYEGSPPGRC